MSVEKALYRAIRRCINEFAIEKLPFFGIPGCRNPTASSVHSLSPVSQLQHAFRKPAVNAGTDEGFQALRKVKKQLKLLTGCDADTRTSLGLWAYLQRQHGSKQLDALTGALQPNGAPKVTESSDGLKSAAWVDCDRLIWLGPSGVQPAHVAVEDAAFMLHRISKSVFTFIGDIDDDDADDVDAAVAKSQAVLDEIAAGIARESPHLFSQAAKSPSDGQGSDSPVSAQHRPVAVPVPPAEGGPAGTATAEQGETVAAKQVQMQVEAISKYIFSTLKMKHETVEWVYDGVSPGLLPEVLAKRKGVPFSLALVYYLVVQRLGIVAEMVSAQGSKGSIASGM